MNVVVVGSSGGGTATLGHTSPVELLNTINCELQRVLRHKTLGKDDAISGGGGIRYALYVSLHHGKGMDNVDETKDIATLYFVDHDATTTTKNSPMLQVQIAHTGILSEVNKKVEEMEQTIIVPAIQSSLIQGVVCISCDPENTNCAVLSAAATMGIPVTGSGGSSLSKVMTIHPKINLVGNVGGSVATTTYTKAVSYTYSLSKSWSVDYSPFHPSHRDKYEEQPSLRSVLDACLPSFIAVCCICKFLTLIHTISSTFSSLSLLTKHTTDHFLLWQLQNQALPTICCIVAASTYSPQHKSSALMAASIASMACSRSIVTGLVAGRLVSWWLGRTLFTCIRLGIPSTMTNIVVAGFVGAVVATVIWVLNINEWFIMITDTVRTCALSFHPGTSIFGDIYGFILGCIFCYGSKVGWYHAIYLPIILIEMESGTPSVIGAMDECTLVLVCAGICFGQCLFLSVEKDATQYSLCRRALLINILCGDFIEVAYPFMESSPIINFFAYLASGLSTSMLLYRQAGNYVMSSAYLPLPISVLISNDWKRMLLASLVSFTVSFSGVCCHQILTRLRNRGISQDDNKQS